MSGAMMPRARVMAHDDTMDIHGLAELIRPTDPLVALVETVAPVVRRCVDAMQVAAALESSGVTDRAARVEYGYGDVFELAEEVRRRVVPDPDPPRRTPTRSWAAGLRDIGHGALYLLPAAIFPAALAALGPTTSLLGIIAMAAIGWTWSGAAAWLAYQMLGRGRPASAGWVLRWSSVAALPLAVGVSAVLAKATGANYGLVVLGLVQIAYQMAVTVLVFYRRESLVFAVMVPAVLGGVAYLLLGPAILTLVVAVGIACVAVVLGLALRQTTAAGARTADAADLHGLDQQFIAVVAFTALSAVFFLAPQARHLTDGIDVALAALPVIAGMGVVESRARRFSEDARELLRRVSDPRRFVLRVWLLILAGFAICVITVSALAAVLLAGFAASGRLSTAGVVAAGAGVLLAGAYFLGFLLGNLNRFGSLCASLTVCLGAYVLFGSTAAGGLHDTIAQAAATGLLVVLYLGVLATCVGEARRHR